MSYQDLFCIINIKNKQNKYFLSCLWRKITVPESKLKCFILLLRLGRNPNCTAALARASSTYPSSNYQLKRGSVLVQLLLGKYINSDTSKGWALFTVWWGTPYHQFLLYWRIGGGSPDYNGQFQPGTRTGVKAPALV